MKKLSALLLSALLLLSLSGCGGGTNTDAASDGTSAEKTEIVFADVGWDSIQLNNELAGLVAESVFGYTWTSVPGSTPISHEALLQGDVDVDMEEWTDNLSSYHKDLEAGKFVELGVNFDDNYQGFYIPRYVADANPGLKTVKDLKDYAHLFPDPEDSTKGLLLGGIPGWDITEIMAKKVKAYGLDEYYNYLPSGSDAVLSASMTSAWDKKAPIVAYYWEPTWLLGKYDFVLLEDDPYDPEQYQNGIGACPAVTVTVGVSNQFAKSNPEYCQFLSKFSVPSAIISEALAYMQDNGADHAGAAKWLLSEAHPELVDQWLTPDQAELLRGVL